MKKTLLTLIAVCALTITSQAQPLKIITIDISKLFEGYYKTQQAGERIRLSLENAQEEDNARVDELKRMAEVYNEVKERSDNPALTDEARQQAESDAEAQLQEVQILQQNRQKFQADTQRSLQQRQNAHRELMLDEIQKVVMALSRERGATLVLDTSGLTSNTLPAVLYSDSAWDISDLVLYELNRDAPSTETEPPTEAESPPE